MCTKLNLRVKSINVAGVKRAFVPCGKCFDCRNKMRQDWVFRLRYDLDALRKKGWKIGFFTLTYSDEFIPFIPYPLFKKPSQCTMIPCFSKEDVRDFLVRLKKACLKRFGAKELRYMLCSEFGGHTKRPHYHGVICFPPSVDERWLFDKIHDIWYRGFVFPRDFGGGIDSSGYEHKPFICDSVKAAAVYAAKYCCKDIGYMSEVGKYEFNKIMPIYRSDIKEVDDWEFDIDWFRAEWDVSPVKRLASVRVGDVPLYVYRLSDYMPFHMQTRQLGKEVCNMSDDKKIYALRHGFSFLGDDMLSPLPVYVREKLLFTPKYVVRNGKRMVEREATEFFIHHAEEIFDAKCKMIAEKFDEFSREEFWRGIGATESESRLCVNVASSYNSVFLARNYLAYYGVDYCQCKNISPCMNWLRRYTDKMDVGDAPVISLSDYYDLHEIVFTLFSTFNKYDYRMCYEKQIRANDVAFVRDFYKHQT